MIFAATERLFLRSFEEKDIPVMVSLLNNWEVVRWLSVIPFPYEEEHARTWLLKTRGEEQAGFPEFFAIADRQTNEFMGGTGLHLPRHGGEEGDYEVGYWLGQRHWGQGIMTEALRATVERALGLPSVKRLVSRTDPENAASRNVLNKGGFVFQGLIPHIAGRGGDQETYWIYKKP